ncbi:hypothetical protein ZWY2020_000359 [Hordeum vulgare]|nr:hypothetical protein ZWY2020_000359 [Hordeum vulgare]
MDVASPGRVLGSGAVPFAARVTPTPPSRMAEDEALDSVAEEEPAVEVECRMPEDDTLDSVAEEEPTVEEEEVWEYMKPSEEAKVYVCNLPYNVGSECLAQLLGQAGVVHVSKVSNSSS